VTDMRGTTGKGVPDEVGIKRYGIDELQNLVSALGEPVYRATQIVEWLYARGVGEYSEMTNLPQSLRNALAASQPLYTPRIVNRQVSQDGTRKYLLELVDGVCVETVGIPDRQRLTVCFSTQAGCSMGCPFCATGRLGLIRQLSAGEMLDQLTTVSRDFDQRITNVVAMGEGEPFANYNATLEALRLMNHPSALNIGARHITVSTAGIIPGIMSLAAEPEQFRLAVSLHSARQSTRNILMPGLRAYDLDSLHQTCMSYCQASGRRISIEFLLIDGMTDTDMEIDALIGFCEDLNCHVNLILMNGIDDVRGAGAASGSGAAPGSGAASGAGAASGSGAASEAGAVSGAGAASGAAMHFRRSSLKRAQEVRNKLLAADIKTSLRRSRGSDIAAACGQLAGG